MNSVPLDWQIGRFLIRTRAGSAISGLLNVGFESFTAILISIVLVQKMLVLPNREKCRVINQATRELSFRLFAVDVT